MIPKLASMAQEVGDALGRRERILPLFRRLHELEKHLEPSSAVESGLTLEARAELILAEEDKLRRTNQLLDRVNDGKAVLDSEHLKNVPSLEGKLLELTKVHLDQNEKCDQFNDEVYQLMDQYNEVIDALTKTFIEYDKVLSAAEEAQKIK